MRSSIAARRFRHFSKFISILCAVTLCCGLVPSAAFAADDSLSLIPEGEQGAVPIVSGAEGGSDDAVSHYASDELPSVDGGSAASTSEDVIDIEGASEDAAFINQDVELTTVVAQAESTKSFFLAQTLESTHTVPVVSAKLPLTDESGEDENSSRSTVVGSFEHLGMTFAIESGGQSVALIAADYAKLPQEFIEKQMISIPDTVTADGIDFYSVKRIAANTFASFMKDAANQDFVGCEALFSDEELLATAGIDFTELDAIMNDERGMVDIDGDSELDTFGNPLQGCAGILSLCIPAGVTTVEKDAFAGFETLQYIFVSAGSPSYASYDGALYNADFTELLFIPEGRTGSIRISPSAIAIATDAFTNRPSIDTVLFDAEQDISTAIKEHIPSDVRQLSFVQNSASLASILRSVIVQEGKANTEMGVRAVYDAASYYESVYTFVNCSSLENGYHNGVPIPGLTSALHYGTANNYVYGRFAGFEIVVYGTQPSTQYISLHQGNSSDVTAYDYFNWISTEVGKYITQRLYWDSGLTSPVAPRTYYQNVDVYLGWGYTSYTISYAANNGTGSHPSAVGLITANNITLPTALSCGITRPGYTLTGWSVNGLTYSPGQTINVGTLAAQAGRAANLMTDSFALTAQWTIIQNTVSFNVNGGSGGQSANVTATYGQNMPAISTTAPARDGYRFGGWYDTSASTGGTQYYTAAGASARTWNKTANTTLYARWLPNTYTVNLSVNGTGASVSPTTIAATYDANITLPAPSRSGHDFLGWNTEEDGSGTSYAAGTAKNLTKVHEGAVDLHAQWRVHVLTVSWQDGGATLDSVSRDYGTTVTMLDALPERSAYTFEGWRSSIDGAVLAAGADYTVPDENTVFTAVWKLKPCTVVFDPGTGNASELSIVQPAPDPESPFTIPAPTARGEGYAFSHWGVTDDDETNLWYPGKQLTVEGILAGGYPEADVLASLPMDGTVYHNVITLHAVWIPTISVSTPLVVTMAIDPDTGEMIAGEGYISTTGTEEVSILSLAYDKTDSASLGGGTNAVFGGDPNGISLTMTSVRDDVSDMESAFASASPFALDLGSQDGLPVTDSTLSAFPKFGNGVSLRIRYGLSFPSGFDIASLASSLPDKTDTEEGSTWSRESYPIANLHYTVGLVH